MRSRLAAAAANFCMQVRITEPGFFRMISRLAGVATVAIATLAASGAARAAGPSINQFEIKDLQSGPGDFEFQSQNAFSIGQPRRQVQETAPGVFTYDDNSVTRQREAAEIQLGITEYLRLRVGIEYEQERFDDPGSVDLANAFAGLKLQELSLEGVLVFVKPKPEGVGLGLLVEYGHSISGDVEEASEIYLGPIIEAHTGPWSAIANLTFVKLLGGNAAAGDDQYVRDRKWDFSYFLQGKYRYSEDFALALESYGTIDRLGDSGTRDEAAVLFGDHDQHRIGPVGYYTFFPERINRASLWKTGASSDDGDDKEWAVTIGAGALFGLNEDTPGTTFKLSIEADY